MHDFRIGLLHAALLVGFSALATLPGPVLAQSGAGPFPTAISVLQFAQASSTVMEIQRELSQLGYNAGPADGLMGARTRSAIQGYQRDNNLLVTGQATSSLLSHVRATARSGGPAQSAPPPTAEPLSQQIADIQATLRRLGYNIRRPSGRLTDETRAAIRSYESDNGLLMSGEPSAELLRHMLRRAESAQAAPPAPVADSNTVARIQTELRMRGYPIPLVTGRMDDQTGQAIREYQQGRGEPVTGEPSAALLADLRAASAEPTSAEGLSREHRAAAQRTLNERGFDAGPPDGVLGPRSRTAIRNFQARNNIHPSGELSARTMELLGISTSAAVRPPAGDQGYRVRIQDDFKDGDYTRNPAWQIAAGSFEVQNGGLSSVVSPSSRSTEDAGRQILTDLLRDQFGVNLPGGQQNVAAAHLPTRIAQQFRITLVLSGAADAHSHIDLGPYQGDRLNHGYRLVYRGDQQRPLQLLNVDANGITEIGSANLRNGRGRFHRLVWQRDADGRMTVRRGGNVLIDVVDRRPSNDFAGFSLINGGGEWSLKELIVEDRD